MSQEQENSGDGSDLSQFEKNRYFQGKLMTTRDMETEQQYHAQRLHTVGRFGFGKGILEGLEIEELKETGNELEVTLAPGVALDGRGRPIVVEHTTTQTLATPAGDELYLFLRYDETALESVPVPEVKGARNEEYASNRTVEVFELVYQETPPDEDDDIPPVEMPEPDRPEDQAALRALANTYHEQHRTPHEQVDDPAVFMGSFRRTRDGSWVRGEETVRRQLVYDNEMLYAALVRHVTDTENPHDTSAEAAAPASAGPDMDEVEEFGNRLQIVQAKINELTGRVSTLTRYLMRKSLKDKIRFFGAAAEQFEDQNAEGARIAREIVEESKEGMRNEVFNDADQYRAHVREVLELDVELYEALEESTTEESLDRYIKAVTELKAVLEEEESVLRLAEAQDQVCEAADSLEVLYDIVPDE